MLAKLRFNPAQPIVARAAGRALVGSLNFTIVNLIQQHLRQVRWGTAVPEASGIDGANEALASAEERTEEARTRAEQGYQVTQDPLELASRVKLVRDSVAEDLLAHAARKQSFVNPSLTFPDPFHVGNTLKDSIDFQLRTAPQISEAVVKAEAKALNVSEEDIRAAINSRHVRQVNLLRDNREEIERVYDGLCAKGSDGHPLGVEADEEVFYGLPAILQLRAAAAADKGLFRARQREVELHLAGRPDAAGNISILDGTRRELLEMVSRWMEKPQFMTSLDEAMSRGANIPTFAPAPHKQQPDEKDEAMSRSKKAA